MCIIIKNNRKHFKKGKQMKEDDKIKEEITRLKQIHEEKTELDNINQKIKEYLPIIIVVFCALNLLLLLGIFISIANITKHF